MRFSVPLVLAVMSLAAFGTPLLSIPVHASSANGFSPGADGIVPVALPTSTSDQTDYATVCPGALAGCTAPAGALTSWSANVWSVTYTGTVSISITDILYEGDYYSLWMTTDPTGLTGWTHVGTTDQVDTGVQLVAPTFDATWTGTGTAYSSTTFNIPVTGTTLFAVRDELFDTMVTLLGPSCGGAAVVTAGCSAVGISAQGGWSPAAYNISFSPAASAGCLDPSGSTSWPTVTFTDFSTADISVSGGAPPGACATMSIQDLFGTQPAGTTTPAVSGPNYYDLSILTFTAGTAKVCFTSSLITSSTVMEYWDGANWVTVSATFTSPNTLCGNIPVTALATPSTPIVIGTSTGPVGVPEFPGSYQFIMAAVSFALLGWAMRKRRTDWGL